MTNVYAPMIGKIVKINLKTGDKVEENQPVMILESMKMEIDVIAPVGGMIKEINVKEQQAVESDTVLAVIG
ncbi:MAG: acetyl-CoA carboxylase biotin carboxyl carrier protein subunit [Candidatus Brocadiia bacterium]